LTGTFCIDPTDVKTDDADGYLSEVMKRHAGCSGYDYFTDAKDS
jgi:hypothetical protein